MRDYFNKRLNRIIIDYLLRENYFDSAKIFIEETGLKVSINNKNKILIKIIGICRCGSIRRNK